MKLSLQEVVKKFGAHTVIDRVSLELDDIHCLALIGPSGGGKSTLLRIVAGLEYPTSGTVALNGREIEYHDEALLRHRRSIGTVFQAYNLFPHLTALRNITLPLEKGARAQRGGGARPGGGNAAALSRCSTTRTRNRRSFPAASASGWRSRARSRSSRRWCSSMNRPSALDPEMTAEVLELIEELKQEGRDLLLVTHEMGFARRLGRPGRPAGRRPHRGDRTTAEQIFSAPESEVTRSFLRRVLRY